MKYVVSWTVRLGGSAADNEAAVKRLLEVYSKWTIPDSTTYHQFVSRVDGNGGFAVVETDNPMDMVGDVNSVVTWEQDGQSMGATMMAPARPRPAQGAHRAAPAADAGRGTGADARDADELDADAGGLRVPQAGQQRQRHAAASRSRQDTFFNGQHLDGFIEFTSTDRQTVASITIELVEHYKGGP